MNANLYEITKVFLRTKVFGDGFFLLVGIKIKNDDILKRISLLGKKNTAFGH